jgi:hypothetical protein
MNQNPIRTDYNNLTVISDSRTRAEINYVLPLLESNGHVIEIRSWCSTTDQFVYKDFQWVRPFEELPRYWHLEFEVRIFPVLNIEFKLLESKLKLLKILYHI